MSKLINLENLQKYDTKIKEWVKNSITETLVTFDQLYPVGAIYLSINSTSPASLFGGSWSPIPSGLALWTTNTGSQDAGLSVDPGLPNITGQIKGAFIFNTTETPTSDNAFALTHESNSKDGTGSSRSYATIDFDASQSNAIYGNSETVQPPAYKVYAWRRIA